MKNLNYSLGLLVASLFLLASCGKYEEGPALSLRTKTARVANTWQVTYAEDLGDNTEITADFAGETFTFERNGDFLENGTLEGTWEFDGNKEFIIVTETDGSTDEFKIVKLKENEMWLEIPNEVLIYFEPA